MILTFIIFLYINFYNLEDGFARMLKYMIYCKNTDE